MYGIATGAARLPAVPDVSAFALWPEECALCCAGVSWPESEAALVMPVPSGTSGVKYPQAVVLKPCVKQAQADVACRKPYFKYSGIQRIR